MCSWLCDRFCPPGLSSDALWDRSHAWEENYAAEWEPAEGDDAIRKRWGEAKRLMNDNPVAALAIHLDLAEGGSAFSMRNVGWHYANGHGCEKDAAAAEEFFRRALCAGSWQATITYAAMLYRRGAHDEWPSTLDDGVRNGFIPSFFWRAWYRYKLSPNRQTAREVRPLLETAAEAGHPAAALTLARWTGSGKFGLREIPRGFRMIRSVVQSAIESEDRSPSSPNAEQPLAGFERATSSSSS